MQLKSVTAPTPEGRLQELGLALPPVPQPVGDDVTRTRIGNIIYTSGTVPWIDGKLQFTGKIGGNLTVEQAYQAFQLSALNGLFLLKSIIGDLSKIARIHRIEGTGASTPDFTDMPLALKGASHLVNTAFGARGGHSRMVYSNPCMPIDCATLVVFWAEVFE